jgi:hypothetical protein
MTPQDAAVLLAFRRLLHTAGRRVLYVRGPLACEWWVAVGRSLYQAQDDRGVIEERDCRDFCGIAAELMLTGQTVIPMRGDRIVEQTSAGSDTYDLLPLESDKPYRFMDPGKLLLRVHTKRILTSDANV